MKSILILALALLTVSAGTDWGMPLISGTCYERTIQYGKYCEQAGISYEIGMSQEPYHVWILLDGRALEPGYGPVEDWRVPGVDYYHPWRTFRSVAALKSYVERGPPVYYFDNVSDLVDCDIDDTKRFNRCGG